MDGTGDGHDALTETGLSCGSCGGELPRKAKFCNECGAPVAQVTRTAEYKQVTVLFADVVHSMDIAAALGPERLREIMAELVDRSTAVVQRYGGTLSQFTGDGIMAIFGAPVALEDHAIRACRAALGVQQEAQRLAAEAEKRDGVYLRLRVGLNSGQVIAGEIGSGPFGYTAIGEQVGMAERMESVAPAGGVMLSASTARLVDGAADLGEPETVRIKGAEKPVTARRLLGIGDRHHTVGRAESTLVGRRLEMAAVEGLLDRAVDGHGAVVGIVGPAGIGKSRLVRELAAMARDRDVQVVFAFCESHTSQVPFQSVARLLRAATGVEGLDAHTARDRLREWITEVDTEDSLLLDDLLGIADPDVELPRIDPDARRRRLTALVNAVSLARQTPAVYVLEDAHWIDEVSESMLANFFTVVPQTPSLVLVTHRPEYEGALTRTHGTRAIALEPLSDSDTAALVLQLLGSDSSVGTLASVIVDRAGGNPFFAEEIVRDLAERGVLEGQPGVYRSTAEGAEVNVPATVQATVGARIDRLGTKAKRTLRAAAVIGSRFSVDLLTALGVEPTLAELGTAELIEQVRSAPPAEYVFRHPLIRTVAYESQLKSDRAQLHRRLAAAIEEHDPGSAQQNAALIAEHLQAAGDLRAALSWHMRAGAWAATRDIVAAWASWERARQVADELPADFKRRTAMRIAARAWLCGNAFRVHANISDGLFEELRELCTAAGDKASLAIGMVGLTLEHLRHGRVREASRLASETMVLVEAIDEPSLKIALCLAAMSAKLEVNEIAEVLRWSQIVIDLTGGDPAKGNIVFGSPLAVALVQRGTALWALGRAGWRDDYDRAVTMARSADPMSYALVNAHAYGIAISGGVRLADDTALRDIEAALEITERSSEDFALGFARWTLGTALMHRESPAERDRGLAVLGQARDMCLQGRIYRYMLPIIDIFVASERVRRGDRDGAIPLAREALEALFQAGQPWSAIRSTSVLVETLLERGADADVAEAEAAITRLAAAPVDEGLVIRDIWLLRMRALLAQARGDDAVYCDYRDRYRTMARTIGFEGHIAWAEAMP
ncbi:adenylate/guanylate cyclase domain-containing protein [Mycobacterium sp. OTB74]|uniref:AAA family ATPase n=1 Tax=Mycobacterium sp. OTB74 TaxID=1853452 RepID=UPI0024743BE0|nr:adenylate/guanylate cyclase domain-containing protein [Mycobacterium sp. OTB74]MDH6244610.1 class 3 adenylate cyclase/ABC-type transport system involved in cytochrome c biogenesis ATPase subunit [Mycobacterium sp. OTB74]